MKPKLENLSDDELLNIASDYSDDNPDFDCNFINSLNQWLYTHDDLTEIQRTSIINIIQTFNMVY